ncbi:MAG: carbohydrate ABC transporter permease, partial [Candidatus Baldrarchaeia archaeon]
MKGEKIIVPIAYFLLVLLAIFTIFPLLWVVSIAIKPRSEMYLFTLPTRISPENLQLAINLIGYSFLNSVVLSFVTSLINMLICFFAAYSFSRMQFRGKNILNSSLGIAYSIPSIFAVIPLFILFKAAGFLNLHPYASLIILYQSLTTPVNIWLATDFINSIPKDIDEAAYIDGCSTLGVLFRIIMPMCAPVMFTMMLMCFVESWNEYILASLFIKNK